MRSRCLVGVLMLAGGDVAGVRSPAPRGGTRRGGSLSIPTDGKP